MDGDEINSIALNLEPLEKFFTGFNPSNLLINRTNESIRLDCSALENCSLAIFSDR